MKIISGVKLYRHDSDSDSEYISISVSKMNDLLSPVEKNKSIILDFVQVIEEEIDSIIQYYFFRDQEINDVASAEFKNQVLNSDWCTFAAKQKLIRHIVKELEDADEKVMKEFDNLLYKIMEYRNSFVHGSVLFKDDEVILSYFSREPRKKTIDDLYLTKIEKNLHRCYRIVKAIYDELSEFGGSDSVLWGFED